MIIHKRVKSMLPVCSKDAGRTALQRIYADANEVVATDGFMLVRMLVNNDVEMPAVDWEPVSEPVLIDVETISAALGNLPNKAALPCNEYVQVSKLDNQYIISSGVPVVDFPVQYEQLPYPNYRQVIPDYTDCQPLKFILDGKLLKKICDLAVKHGDSQHRIVFEIPTQTKEGARIDTFTGPVKFTISNDDGQVFDGLICPLRPKD